MSEFGRPRDCNNHCGGLIYFDAHSSIGHPTADKWLPLEYKEGRKTDLVHFCPNNNKKQNCSLTAVAAAVTTTKPDLDNLSVIKAIAAALNEYITIKEGK